MLLVARDLDSVYKTVRLLGHLVYRPYIGTHRGGGAQDADQLPCLYGYTTQNGELASITCAQAYDNLEKTPKSQTRTK